MAGAFRGVRAAGLAGIGVLAMVVTLVLGMAAAPDKKAPTAPKSLRVTSITPSSVSLAWNASTDDSGFLTYWIKCGNGYSKAVPMSQTSGTFTDGINAGVTYSFYVYAVDGSGNKSPNSNTVSASLPPDTSPPTVPVLTVTDVGPTHVSLSWTSSDASPPIYYWVYGSDWGSFAFVRDATAMSGMMNGLSPSTTYTFWAKARDKLRNESALSTPITVTTGPVNTSDTTPPTAPANLWASTFGDGSTEFDLYWTQSTDNVDPQGAIRYEVFINGVLSEIHYGTGHSPVNYGEFGTNHIEVFAIDAAGNRSAAGTVTLVI